jgi:hypothetical protein
MGSAGSSDYGYGIAVDTNGNVYVVGRSQVTWGTPVNAHAGGGDYDAFAVKLDEDGNRLWHTFMGSGSYDTGNGIAVDTNGNVYVVGTSGDTWGTPVNDYGGGGNQDAFAAKLDENGNRL